MKNLQDTGRVVVNIDVVINKQNYKHLPEIIEYYYNLGIREFDLLHIIPFGRGFDEHRHSLFFDLNDAVPYFRRAFQWAEKPGVYLWTNRLPVQYLEDFERLIQDPHKLFYEFDGGRHNFRGLPQARRQTRLLGRTLRLLLLGRPVPNDDVPLSRGVARASLSAPSLGYPPRVARP
jgi:hypothetical protein